MAILLSNEILDSVKKELQVAEKSVQIITAYCKENSFIFLNNCINPEAKERRLLVRFRMDDVLKGSTDFSILELGLKYGWEVYVRFDLHAKTYIVDNKRGLIGSANATNSGLSIGKPGNMEMATLVDIESKDLEKIDKLYKGAIKITEPILIEMKKQIDSVDLKEISDTFNWNSDITNLFHPNIETLFSYELPDEVTLNPGEYLAFIDEVYDGDRDRLRESFRWSNAYLWLLNALKENDDCMYFGELSAKLHDTVVSDPKPYRREVKQMLANLLSLIELLEMEEVVIDRPNYSQRVRIKK